MCRGWRSMHLVLVYLRICVFVYLCICVFVYLCICVFMYLCIWVFECFWHKEIHLVRLGDLGQLTEDWVGRSGEKAAAVRVPRYMRREGALYCIYLYIYQSLFKLSSDLSASLEVQVSIAVWYKIQSAANHTFTFSVIPAPVSRQSLRITSTVSMQVKLSVEFQENIS